MKYLMVVFCLLTTACTAGCVFFKNSSSNLGVLMLDNKLKKLGYKAFLFADSPSNPDVIFLERKLKTLGYKVSVKVNDFKHMPNVKSGVIICSYDHSEPSDIDMIKASIEALGYANVSVYFGSYENHIYREQNVGIYLRDE